MALLLDAIAAFITVLSFLMCFFYSVSEQLTYWKVNAFDKNAAAKNRDAQKTISIKEKLEKEIALRHRQHVSWLTGQ